MTLLQIRDLNKNYRKNTILQNITFDLSDQDIVLLKGDNGSGKSTLLKCIIGFEKPEKGEIIFSDTRIEHLASNKRVQLGIGYMPQESFLIPTLTVKQTINLIEKIDHNRLKLPKDTKNLFDQILDLENISEKRIHQLSRGERRKLEFMITFMNKSKLYMLDEPFAGWDKPSKELCLLFLKKIANLECSLLIIEHDGLILSEIGKLINKTYNLTNATLASVA